MHGLRHAGLRHKPIRRKDNDRPASACGSLFRDSYQLDGLGIAGSLLVLDRILFLIGFFDSHILKFFGIKNFTTLKAFDKLGVFMPGDNTYPGMFAGGRH